MKASLHLQLHTTQPQLNLRWMLQTHPQSICIQASSHALKAVHVDNLIPVYLQLYERSEERFRDVESWDVHISNLNSTVKSKKCNSTQSKQRWREVTTPKQKLKNKTVTQQQQLHRTLQILLPLLGLQSWNLLLGGYTVYSNAHSLLF